MNNFISRIGLGRMAGNSIGQSILKTSVTNLIVMLVVTVTSVITARMFGVSGRGELTAILFWPPFLSGLCSLGMPTSLIYNMRTHANHKSLFIMLSVLSQFLLGILVGIISWFWIHAWLHNFSEEVIAIAQWFVLVSVPLIMVSNVLGAIAQSVNDFNLYNSVRLSTPTIYLLGLIIWWLGGFLTIELATATYLCAIVFALLWNAYKLRPHLHWHGLKAADKKSPFALLYKYGSKVYGVELLGTLYNQVDKLIIMSLLGARELGIYTVVYALSRVFNTIQNAIANVIFPRVSGLSKDVIIRNVSRAFRLSMMLMLIILVPSLIVGRFLLGFLFGEQFLEGAISFYILSVECIVGGGSWILASSFNAAGRPGLVFIRQTIALSVTIGMFFVFIPLFGVNGIALAMLIGGVVRLVFSIIMASVLFKVPVVQLVVAKDDYHFLKNLYVSKFKKRRGEAEHADA